MALDLGAPPKNRPGFACAVQRVADERPEDLAAVMGYMRDRDWSAANLADALAAEGIDSITRQVIATHRANRCQTCADIGRSFAPVIS